MRKKKSARGATKGAAETSAEEMGIALLRRGDGMVPIVGLGGSAGGIAALQEFFEAMPVDSGMAFVVILHISPTHESTLPELFQRSTTMPVVAAMDGAAVKPNSVYVIPPGKFLASANGHLRLTDAEEHRGKRVAVDYFFRSLAETHGAQSLAVVLSGAGGDGALGLKRVKELGGLTIAQDPDEAEHPDMPRSAISAGVVDWVLGVKEMPAKLLTYVKQRGELRLPGEDGPHPAAAAGPSPDDQEAALRAVLAFLHTRTGRDFSCYKRATIVRRIARRMQVNGLGDVPAYLGYLRTHAGEANALLQDLLISVTNFFRDPASFAALERTIPEMFIGKQAGDTVRVWVAGCATGEEAYSIAILLCEHASTLVGPPQIQVFATDLDEDVIREAREGLYPETIAADVSEERLRHFFIPEQGSFRIRRAVRELVLFAPHDVLKDSPFSRLDLVSCRNLLIYLNREAQNRAFDIFHFALRPGGRLFLGTSEAVDEDSPLFAVLDKKQRLYIQRAGPQRVVAVTAGPGTLARALALQDRMRERPTVPGRSTVGNGLAGLDQALPLDSGLPPGELHYRLIERFSPPSILVNSAHEIVHLSESAGRFLQFTGGEPTRNLLRTVHPMLRVQLRAVLYAAAQTQTPASASRVPVEAGDARSLVDIRVTPAGDLAPDLLLVVFEEHPADETSMVTAPRSADADRAALHLERELVATKTHLRDTIEQSEASTEELKASNEELQAMNEELRSATEELETSREELQSINEELTTVNDELKSNVDQLARSNRDLQNLMAATDIATVFLDRELRIQRFTPSAKALFNFIPTDLGRPLSDLSRQLDYPEIVADAERSLAHLLPAQREVSAGARWYIARILPYRTADDHIAGVVLTFLDITAQKESETALRASDERSEFVRRSTGIGFWYCDLPFDVLQWDEVVKAHFHVPPDAAVTIQTFYDRIHPDDRESTRRAIERSIEGRTSYDIDYRTVDPDTAVVTWVRAIGRTFYAADGTPTRFDGVTLDVSDRKWAEQEIARLAAESERQRRLYETVLNNTPDFVYVFSLDHKVLYANDALIRMWGRGHEGAIGRTFLEIGYEPWHAEMHDREIDQVRATRQPIRGEVPFTGTSGRRDYDYIFVPIIGADGEVEAVAGTTRDVTERKAAEKQLRDGQEQLDFALAAAELGQWALNLADGTARRTLRHDQIFGYDALLPVWTYDTFLHHVVPDDRAAVDAEFKGAVATGSAWAVECRIHRADGAKRHIWTKALIRRDAEGRVEWMLGIVGDVTDRRQAEERQAFLVQLADTLRPLSDPTDVQAEASRLLGELLGANRVVYFEIRGDEYVIERDHTAGVRPLAGRYPVAAFGPAVLSVLLEGRTVIEADATTEPDRPPRERAAFAAIQVRGHVDVPLVKGGRFVAGMTVQVSDRRDWTQQEVALIEETAERTWAAVERVRAEAALRQSEERLRMALSAARMVAWEYDPVSGAVFTSDNATDVYGLPAAERTVNIERLFAMLHREDVERHQSAVAAAVAAGEGFNSQFRIVRPDNGAVQWMEERGHAVRDEADKPVRLVGVNMDITRRKAVEDQLREREAFIQRILDALPGVMYVFNRVDQRTEYLNDQVRLVLGVMPDEVLASGRPFLAERVHPDDLPTLHEHIDRLASLPDREVLTTEYRIRHADGRWLWFLSRDTVFLRTPDGTPLQVLGVATDITARKEAELRVKESEQRFRLVADAAPVLIWKRGADKLCYWFNKPWLAFTGRSMAHEVGNGWAEGVHPDDIDNCLQTFSAAFDARRPFSMEYRLRRHDGEFRWLIDNGVPRYGPGGEFEGYIGSCLDVTDYKNAEAELRDVDRRKDEFLATLAHELRNPLAPISNGLHVMRLAGATGMVEQARTKMERQLTQLIRLVDDLLDLSRVTSGKLELRRESVDLGTVIYAAIETSRPLIEQAGHELTVALPSEPVVLDGDAARLSQVVSNLLNNSAKYTHRGGHIQLAVRREDGLAVLTVADDGIGIPPTMLGRVFEMFTQVDRSLEKATGGLGIGLWLVKGVVEMHGGTIEARSEGEGRGSQFIVRLPLVSPAVQNVEPPASERPVRSSSHRRILVADDNVDSAESLGQLLELLGNEVRTANDGLEALDVATTFKPDVVLLDIGMPKLNGHDACRLIRDQPWGKQAILIAMTGWGQDGDKRRSRETGFDHHLVKPVDLEALEKLLASLEPTAAQDR